MSDDEKKGWFKRLRSGLRKSSDKFSSGLVTFATARKLDDAKLEEIEELLITADLGVETAMRVAQNLAKSRFGKEVTADEIRDAVAEEVLPLLAAVARPLPFKPEHKPQVVLVCGVNGSGKTTTIGKLAKQFTDQGKKITLGAGDTFRAAAVEQLKIWGQRTNCPVIARDTGADAAGVVYDAIEEAERNGSDMVLIDTAGRLQNQDHLMAELEKIIRVMRKKDPTAPHDVVLVLDATVGQNAHNQVETFLKMINVTGLIVTKLDGTARGGVLVALAQRFAVPIHAIGVGEGVDDLRPFDAREFGRSLLDLKDE